MTFNQIKELEEKYEALLEKHKAVVASNYLRKEFLENKGLEKEYETFRRKILIEKQAGVRRSRFKVID